MTLTLTDLAAIFLMFFLAALIDKVFSSVYLRVTGKCWLCMRNRMQLEVDKDLGVDDEDDDGDLAMEPA